MRRASSKLVSCLLVLQACGPSAKPGASTAPIERATPPAAVAEAAGPPATRKQPVTDTYHGVTVSDPYRWLESDGAPEVKAWSAQQNAYTRAVLGRIPALPAIGARIERAL